MTERPRAIVAMSGGVDSSVAVALLVQEGYDVSGVTMRLWDSGDDAITPDHQGCCSIDDIEDARRVCSVLGVPHYVLDVRDAFREHVMDHFVAEYQRGRTPHPCISCNDRIKFDFLLERAAALGASHVATGHYARIVMDAAGELSLLRGVDRGKDQSYVLFGMTPDLLRRVLLPVGWHTKARIREIAAEAGLHLADKRDSQEICFVPAGSYREFLKTRVDPRPGDLVNTEGRILGQHGGVEFFTVGQRRGLGVATGERLFVTRVDAGTAQVVLGPEEALLSRDVQAGRVNYVGNAPSGPVRVTAKIRYNGADEPAVLTPGGESATLRFDEPQRAVTPGQAAVFYDGERVIGGGFID